MAWPQFQPQREQILRTGTNPVVPRRTARLDKAVGERKTHYRIKLKIKLSRNQNVLRSCLMSVHSLGDKIHPCDSRGQTLVVCSRSKAREPGCGGRGYPREGPMLRWTGGTRWSRGSGMRFEPTARTGNRSWRVFWTQCKWCLKSFIRNMCKSSGILF